MDYNAFHPSRANRYRRVSGRKVLVVGCNTGLDCSYFVNLGAAEVHGVDVVEDIGRDFVNERTTYHRISAEDMSSLPSNYFDVVYSFATMEHVPDVAAAFAEMGRITAPGGLMYTVASPLWHSRFGHHYPQYFSDLPWAHLRFDEPAEAKEYLDARQIQIAPEHGSSHDVAHYMFDRSNFNMLPASAYAAATATLSDFLFKENRIDIEPEEVLPPAAEIELVSKGHSSLNLRSVTHQVMAKKRGSLRWPFWGWHPVTV